MVPKPICPKIERKISKELKKIFRRLQETIFVSFVSSITENQFRQFRFVSFVSSVSFRRLQKANPTVPTPVLYERNN